MPNNSAPNPEETRLENDRVGRAGANQVPVTSPFNYGAESEEEYNRNLAMERANDKIKNNPSRPIF